MMLTRRNLLGSLLSSVGLAPTLRITKAEVLRLEPDDIVLITVPPMPKERRVEIGWQFREATGCSKVLVQPEGMKTQIIRPSDA